jgi:2-polyprenyl-6-methoxyphenol hydroxylase-like FAD-dependent oxidoreductase
VSTNGRNERFDAVVIGARCAGSAAAIALARAGRRVLAVDRSPFPSDTLSTHLNFPSAVAEMQRLGALPRVRDTGAPECREGMVAANGIECIERFTPYEGIDYALCNPRPAFDLALVETAREAGAEVRERTSLVDVLWSGGRASGVRLRSRDGGEYDVRCSLVIGADGRGSTTAERVGAAVPYRGSRNGRGLAFFYCDDPQLGTPWRGRVIQLRALETHTLVFPCPEDRMLVLFMGPAEEIPLFRKDPDGMLRRMLAENPLAAERVGDAPNRTKFRSTGSVSAFYRRSSGPGWALAGDAGHFKDPVIGQGMRDSMRFGRLLGEAAASVIDDPLRLDRALLAAERQRDRECMASYHWGNRESRIMTPTPLLYEVLREFHRADPPHLMHMFDRVRAPHHVINPLRGTKLAVKAALRRGTDRRALLRELREEMRLDVDVWREELTRPFRPTRVWASERPDFDVPGGAREGAPAAKAATPEEAGDAIEAPA